MAKRKTTAKSVNIREVATQIVRQRGAEGVWTLGKLKAWAERNGLPDTTRIVVPAPDHSYREPEVGLADVRVYPDGYMCEGGDEGGGKVYKAVRIV